jgi:hypothetical protein
MRDVSSTRFFRQKVTLRLIDSKASLALFYALQATLSGEKELSA